MDNWESYEKTINKKMNFKWQIGIFKCLNSLVIQIITNDDMPLYINQTSKNLKAPMFIAGRNTKKTVISNIAFGNKKCDGLEKWKLLF